MIILPKISTSKIFQEQNDKRDFRNNRKRKKEKLGLTAVNKHIGRVNQLFSWASNTGYIDKTLHADLRLKR